MTLAFALRATPGTYAVLLGAGASVASGVPAAWEIQQDLIERLAAAEGTKEIGDPFDWYKRRFGHEATYDGLLEALTATTFERQALLKTYFEPDEQEREQGRKGPTAAHRAVARLAAAGLVRIVLTTNFDRLTEAALREAGVEPTVVSHPDDITGLAPLHTIACLVVHLHGDYLAPTSMLNTPEELGTYTPQADKLLDDIFDNYGLIIAGWSAKYDPALRNALSRCTTRRFATYWADPRPLADEAHDLLTRRSAAYVQADADTFFGQVADAADALADTAREHPVSIAIAVASAKRALAGAQLAIPLHDMLRREGNRVAALPLRTSGPFDGVGDGKAVEAEHERRLRMLESETERLLALVATTAYWGSEDTDSWWLPDIGQLAQIPAVSGVTALINLVGAPGTMMMYAAGTAAVAAQRWLLLVRILTETRVFNPYEGEHQPAAVHGPQSNVGLRDASERLHRQLLPVFTDHLTLSETAYADAWERFEYLRLITQHSAGRGMEAAYLRRTGSLGQYRVAPESWLREDLDRHGEDHPLLRAGFLGGDLDRLKAAKEAFDTAYSVTASRAMWGA
ncbi:SIR2 family protein [Actinacidiphila oryziradicis]|uniref:SIR2 family protein n=1 Tax=Actinacidiphila oryziradicis TaxID=2571141 RepID=UPI00145ECA19|nr:SIR2 family protein [Actinacidiphila oryziradicis]